MSFIAPWWLLLLLPWVGLTIWLLIGSRQGTAVPFLHLWPREISTPAKIKHSIQFPPISLICAILAMLFAILAAARPLLQLSKQSQPDLTIDSIAARRLPRMQVMVRVKNNSPRASAMLSVAGKSQTIDLPATGETKSFFVDLDDRPGRVDVQLEQSRATLRLQQAAPVVDVQGDVPPTVQKVIQAYQKVRQPPADATHIVVTSDTSSTNQPAIFLAASGASTVNGKLVTEDHPITANVDWQRVVNSSKIAPNPPTGWQPVVSAGDRTIVAVRSSPARQVWIGVTDSDWPLQADYVIFWANALDWVNNVHESYAATMDNPAVRARQVDLSAALSIGAVTMILLTLSLHPNLQKLRGAVG